MLVPAAGAAGIPGGGGHIPAAVRALGAPAAAAVLPGEVPVHGSPCPPGMDALPAAGARPARGHSGLAAGLAGLAAGRAGRASGRAWRRPGTAGAAGQQPRVKAGLHSRSHLTASPLQAEAINALRGWDARLHPFLDDKPREGMRGEKKSQQATKTTLAIFRKV